MKRILLISLWCCIGQLTFAQGEMITLKTTQGDLAGTLLVPETLKTKKWPVVLIIAGSGPTDQDGNSTLLPGKNNSLKMLAEGLAKAGVASLRYDKRGVGKSASAAIQEADLRFSHFVEDAKAWVELLQADTRFSEVIVAGHSEGALIGMIVAKETKVSQYISIAGAGQRADKLLKEQLAQQPDFIKDEAYKILDELVIGKTVDKPNPMLNSLFRPSVQPYLISWFNYDPEAIIKTLDIPILLVQGTTDIQVGVKEAKNLKTANPKAELLLIEDMNHVLKLSSADRMENLATYSNPKLPLAEGFMLGLLHFIKK